MNRSKEPLTSNTEKNFILHAIKERKRLDGREIYDYRNLNIEVGNELGNITVTLGNTRVQACVHCEVTKPKPNRPTEGQLYFNVNLSPMASPAFDLTTRSSNPVAVETTRVLERCFKESRAVDMESLCIIAGQKVWSVKVDIHVLDHCGNIIDASAIAAITALKHFKRPDVTVSGETATIHSLSEREPVPLSIHHVPVCVTYAFFHNGLYLSVDPTREEETVMDGKLIVSMNTHQELCVLQLAGGVALLPEQILRCIDITKTKVLELVGAVKTSLNIPVSLNEETRELPSILETDRSEANMELECNPELEPEHESEAMDCDIVVIGDNTVKAKSVDKSRKKQKLLQDNIVKEVVHEVVDLDSEEEDTVVVMGTDVSEGGSKYKKMETKSCDNDSKNNSASMKKPKMSKRKKKKN